MSDLISRKEVISGIQDLLKSPYAHSQLGAISSDEAYYIRKEMAETIIDLCIKSAKNIYEVEKVLKQLNDLQRRYDTVSESDTWTRFGIGIAIEIVKGAVKDE